MKLVVIGAVILATLGCQSSKKPSSAGSKPLTSKPLTTTTIATTTSMTLSKGLMLGLAQPPTDTCPAIPAYNPPDSKRPRYNLDIDIKADEGLVEGQQVEGEQQVRFVPGQSVDRLVFRLWPNGSRQNQAGAHLEVTEVRLGKGRLGKDSVVVQTELANPTTLVVPLATTLNAGSSIDVYLSWRLTLPGPSKDRLATDGTAIRLGSFFPLLAWEPGVGWALEPPTTRLAEAGTSPVADFTLRVKSPPDLSVLASGIPDGSGTWRAVAVRDIALSVGKFQTVTAVAQAPHLVTVTVGVHEGVTDDPNRYLQRIVSALEDFSRRYGPYPYTTYTMALTPGLTGGIEYPGFTMQGPNSHGRSTPHEVAHQWFYGLVGNNQGRDPWLDESLATWAEARFEGTLPNFMSKTIPTVARGQATQPMSWWDQHGDSYYRGVYVQPSQSLGALGNYDLVDCALRHYVATNAFQIARPANLTAALKTIFPDVASTFPVAEE